MKLRQLLLIGFMLVALTSIIPVGSFSFINARASLKRQVVSHLETAVVSRANHIKTFLEALRGRMIDFSSDGKIKDCLYDLELNNVDGCTADNLTEHLIKNKLPVLKEAFSVFTITLNGQIVSSTNKEHIGIDISNDPCFIFGKEKPFIRDVYFSETLQQNILTISAPVIREGELVGVVAANIKTEPIYEILLDRTGLGESGEIYLVNKDQLMISPSRFQKDEDTILKQVANSENSRECFDDFEKYNLSSGGVAEHEEKIIIAPDYRGVTTSGTHGYISEMQWCLLAEVDETETLAPVIKLRNQIIIIALIITIFVLMLAFYFARLISNPIIKLKDAVAEVGEGKLHTSIKIKSKTEIGDLVKAFNEMAGKLREYYSDLENKVKKRTAELEKEKDAAEKISSFAVGRELKMVELKKKIKELEKDNI